MTATVATAAAICNYDYYRFLNYGCRNDHKRCSCSCNEANAQQQMRNTSTSSPNGHQHHSHPLISPQRNHLLSASYKRFSFIASTRLHLLPSPPFPSAPPPLSLSSTPLPPIHALASHPPPIPPSTLIPPSLPSTPSPPTHPFSFLSTSIPPIHCCSLPSTPFPVLALWSRWTRAHGRRICCAWLPWSAKPIMSGRAPSSLPANARTASVSGRRRLKGSCAYLPFGLLRPVVC